MVRLHRAAEACSRGLAAFGLICLIIFAAATLVNGISRSLFSFPIEAVSDTANLVVAAAVASCFPMALLQKSNIRIDLLGALLPAGGHAALRLLADIAVLAVIIGIAWQLFVYAGHAAEAGDCTVMLEIETAPVWYYVATMLAIAAAVQAIVVSVEFAAFFSAVPSRPSPPVH